MAIEIVSTTTLALGSRALSTHGAIVTRLVAIEEMAGMNMLCSDKTGTLTLNKMVIQVRAGALGSERALNLVLAPPVPFIELRVLTAMHAVGGIFCLDTNTVCQVRRSEGAASVTNKQG